MTERLLERTKALLRDALAEDGVTIPQLAEKSGLGYEWLKKFAAGDIPDPRIKRLQCLHDFLARRAAGGHYRAESRGAAPA
jgi:hypothetical protein